MPRINPVKEKSAPPEIREMLNQASRAAGGRMINLHRELSDSSAAFKAHLGFGAGLPEGSLLRELREEIPPTVSNFEACRYRLPVRSASAEKIVRNEDERKHARNFDYEDAKQRGQYFHQLHKRRCTDRG